MTRVRVTGPARRDIDRALKRSQEEFGPNAQDRYRSLLDQALKDLQLDPARVGVRAIDDVRKGYFIYHLRSSTTSTRGPTVRRPRHLFVFYIDTCGDVIIARLFHEGRYLRNILA